MICESILSELGKKNSHFYTITTKEIREMSKDVHNFALLNFVIKFKKFKDLSHASIEIYTHKLRTLEN